MIIQGSLVSCVCVAVTRGLTEATWVRKDSSWLTVLREISHHNRGGMAEKLRPQPQEDVVEAVYIMMDLRARRQWLNKARGWRQV